MDTGNVVCYVTQLQGTPVFVVPAIGNHLKQVFGGVYSRKQALWFFPAFHPYCNDVVHDFSIVAPNMVFSDEALAHIESVKTVAARSDDEVLSDFSYVTKPFEHQKEALAFAVQHIRCGLLYDMGLGKTKVVVDLIRYTKSRALVLAPVVGLGTWQVEAKKHSGGELRVVCMRGTPKKKVAAIEEAKDADVLVVGYDTAKRYHDMILNDFPYDMIVADESHQLRSPSSDRTKHAIALASKAARRLILSGTPSLGNPMHLFGQLSFLGKHIPAPSQWIFQKRHLIRGKGSNKKIVVGFKNLDMLNDKLHRVAIRKEKHECSSIDLPARTITDILFEPSAEQKKIYNAMVAGALIELSNGVIFEPNMAAVVIQKMLQVLSGFIIEPDPPVCDDCFHVAECVLNKISPFTALCIEHPKRPVRKTQRLKSNPKLVHLIDLLDSILVNDKNKVIIWCYFTEELNIVQEHLESQDIEFIRVDGSNSSRAQELAAEFNEGSARVWLAQVATGIAITLNAAAYMIYFGLTYHLDAYLQSMDRNFRIGQEQPTFVYRLTAEGSVLEFVATALAAKQNIANTLATKIECVLCERGVVCAKENVEPFDKGCIHKSKVSRTVTRPGKL